VTSWAFVVPRVLQEARNLAPLEPVHSDLRKMNDKLTKGGKRYFITFIDDCTRFCYAYLLKSMKRKLTKNC
jgi:hypothetical protein